jgi:hypothetical protein
MTASLLPDPSTALDRIVAVLASAVPAGVAVKRIGGAFDGAEIRRHVTTAPAVLVACLGLSNYDRRGTGSWTVQADLVTYVLTRDTPAQPRDRSALALVADALRQIARSNWDAPDAFGLPDQASIEASNLYGGDIDSIAVALWAVTWRQPLYLSVATQET